MYDERSVADMMVYDDVICYKCRRAHARTRLSNAAREMGPLSSWNGFINVCQQRAYLYPQLPHFEEKVADTVFMLMLVEHDELDICQQSTHSLAPQMQTQTSH